ncbi:hypothetical protein [Jiella mangrovi]|uniref:Uncharacterized protein n=1 Tax=Jiella mangrovi TaxID=2821407 RepID=A0ABS4BG16_9HYPH|nr:hypothetical protein [Jiella mangrovi]MBP0615704.1 hypothetical protein [Jiella mangrovi]
MLLYHENSLVNGKPMSWSRIAQRMMADEIDGTLYDYEEHGLIEGEALRRFAAQISMLTEPKLDWCVNWLRSQKQLKEQDFETIFPEFDTGMHNRRPRDDPFFTKWHGYWRVIHSDDNQDARKRRKILFELSGNDLSSFSVTEFVEFVGNKGDGLATSAIKPREIIIGTGALYEVSSVNHLIRISDQKRMAIRHYYVVADLKTALVAVHGNSLSSSDAQKFIEGWRRFDYANDVPRPYNTMPPLAHLMNVALFTKM